jgi:methionyl-tRNA synthetase
VNGYVSEQQPWKVAKDPDVKARLATILYTSAEVLRAVAILHNPPMPRTAAMLWTLLGAEAKLGSLMDQRVQDASAWVQLPPAPPSPRATPSSTG